MSSVSIPVDGPGWGGLSQKLCGAKQGPELVNMSGKGLVACAAVKVGGMQCLVISTHHAPLVPAVSPSWDYEAFFFPHLALAI